MLWRCLFSSCIKASTWRGSSKSYWTMWTCLDLDLSLSTVTVLTPLSRSADVNRPVPAKTSTTRIFSMSRSWNFFDDFSANESPAIFVEPVLFVGSLGVFCSPSSCGGDTSCLANLQGFSSTSVYQCLFALQAARPWFALWHLIHTWAPFLQRPFCTDSLHPFTLNAQHMGWLLLSNWLKDLRSSGHLARAFGEAFAFFLGLGLRSGGSCSPLSAKDELASLCFTTPFGTGSRCIVMRGSYMRAFISWSMGKSPAGVALRLPEISYAINVNIWSPLSACSILTFAKSAGTSLVMLFNKTCNHCSCVEWLINRHWLYANPLRCMAHWNCNSLPTSALRTGAGVASFNVCSSTVTVCGFSFNELWISASRFVHCDGGSYTVVLVSGMFATMSTNAYDGWVSPRMWTPRGLFLWSNNLASFSAARSLRTPSVESMETCDLRCATTNVWASKCNLLSLARRAIDMSAPPLISDANCLKTSSDTGDCGVPAANANCENVLRPLFCRRVLSGSPGSINSQRALNTAVESAKDMALYYC